MNWCLQNLQFSVWCSPREGFTVRAKGWTTIRQNDQLRKCWLSPGRSGGLMHWWRSLTHTGHPGTYAGVSVCIKRVFTVRALDTEWPHSALSLSAQSSRAAWLGPSSAGLARAGCWAITGFTLHTLISTEQKNTQDTPASQGLHMECKHAQTFILSTKQITCLEFARKNNGVKSSSMMMTVRGSRVANLAQSEASDEVS